MIQQTSVSRNRLAIVLALMVPAVLVQCGEASELLIGTAQVSITPSQPVALLGQVHTRIAREVESEVTATALALETRDGETVAEQALIISCDLALIQGEIQDRLRQRLKERLPDFDNGKLFLSATHTHTAPVLKEGVYVIEDQDVIRPGAYIDFLVRRLEAVAVRAWQNRRPGGVAWGLGQALVAHNRRAVYADGSARMYGDTDVATFRGIEGYEDHYVDVLFFFNTDRELIAAAVNVACPAQEVEGREKVNADFWHETRKLLRQRFGEGVQVMAWIGAGGDQSPHLMWYERAEERMRKLRGLTRLQEIARRIDLAVDEAYQGARQDIRFDTTLVHHASRIKLPARMVTDEEFREAKAVIDAFAKLDKPDPRQSLDLSWNQAILDRYGRQQDNRYYSMEMHVLRLGDVAVCTNPFELYTEYGVRIRARSKAIQTFVVQLACDSGAYLPTAEAIRGGSYSTAVFSNLVGPEGGDSLVDQTVAAINTLWD